jgi:CAAX prenyl protease-like protein
VAPILFRVAPFAVFIAFLAAQSFLDTPGPWLVAARGLAVAALLIVFWPRYTELRGPKSPAKEWILAITVGLAVFVAWIHLDIPGLAFQTGPGFDPGGDRLQAGIRFATLALVVPPMEELFWRSFLLRWIDSRNFLAMDPRRASRTAFALSSALFATEHSLWFAGLLAGLAYTWLYVRSGNLWIPIVSHAITNATLGLWILATGNWRFW